MNKFDSLFNKYTKEEKGGKAEKQATPKSKEKSLPKTDGKQQMKTDKKEKGKEVKPSKMESKVLDQNLKLVMSQDDQQIKTNVLTRSASKKDAEDSISKSSEKKINKSEPEAKKVKIEKNNSDNFNKRSSSFNYQSHKKEFLPKSSFLLKKNLKFKNESTEKVNNNTSNNINSNINKNRVSVSTNKSIASKSPAKETNSTNPKKQSRREMQMIEAEAKHKNKYQFVKSKVKQFLKNQDEKIEERKSQPPKERASLSNLINSKNKERENSESKEKNTVPNLKKKSENFVRLNMKKGYQEKHLVRHKNFRRMKLDKGKAFYKLQEKLNKNTDNYLGTGKDGLEAELILDGEEEDFVLTTNPIECDSNVNNSNNKIPKNEYVTTSNVAQHGVPHFSEGFYSNVLEENKSALKAHQNINNDLSNIKPPKPSLTPTRLLTNKFTSVLKSSLKKNVPLDTELRILSKEFRYLLSGKKKEAEDFIIREQVEKKLNFGNTIIPQQENLEGKMLVDEESPSHVSEEDLNDSEVNELENDILVKVLEENFGFKSFLPGQLESIKNILNNRNTLTILPPGSGKSLCFQLPALVSEGLTIVISPLLALITDQITRLPPCLSGACLSSLTNHKQRQEIFEAIRLRKIKILFITPERFAIENFSEVEEISFICFDEATCVCPISSNYRSAYISVKNIINKIKPNVLLFLANNLTPLLQESLTTEYKIEEIIKDKITWPQNLKIYVNKEENKLVALLKLLKTYKQIGSTIVFCNTKRNVDKVTSFLNQNGLSVSSYHSGKSDLERQVIQSNFMNDKIKIIVCTIAFSMGISKMDVRMVALFDMPPSIEHFLQQIGRGGRDKKETLVHVFLHDEDYFTQRNMVYMENIDRSQILKFLDHFCQLVTGIARNQKRTFSEAFENKPIITNVDGLLPKTINVNFTSALDYCGIKKQSQLYLLHALIDKNNKQVNADENSQNNQNKNENDGNEALNSFKINSLGIGPSTINLRFYKYTAEKLAETESHIKIILESSRDYQGVRRFSTLEVCQKIGITYIDLINYLYHLQSKSEVGYETKDEGLFMVVSKLPDSFNSTLTYLHSKIQYLINLNLKKLNAAYVLLRKFAVNSLDVFLNKTTPIKCLSLFNDYSSYEKEFRDQFENYFNIHDGILFIYYFR